MTIRNLTLCLAVSGLATMVLQVLPARALQRPTRVCPPPESLSAGARAKLDPEFKVLSSRQTELDGKIRAQEDKCRGVRSDQKGLIADCERERVPIEQAWQKYEPEVAAYDKRVRAALDAEHAEVAEKVATARKQRNATLAELKQYVDRLPGLQADLEEWAQLPEAARLEARDKALNILASFALDKLLKTKKERVRLTQAQLESVERQLAAIEFPPHTRAYLFDNPQLQLWRIETLDKRVTLRLQLAQDKTDVAVLKALKELKRLTDLMEADLRLNQPEVTEVLQALLPVLKMFLKDPVGKLLIDDVELGTALGYLGLARAISGARIAQLDALTELQFRAIRALGPRYEADVKAQHQLEGDVQRLEYDRKTLGKGVCSQ